MLTVFFTYKALKYSQNGIGRSLLSRARIFKKYLGINPVILSHDYDSNIVKHYQYLVFSGALDEKSNYINMYAAFQGTDLKKHDSSTGQSHHYIAKNDNIGEVKKDNLDKDGGRQGYRYYTKDGELVRHEVRDISNNNICWANFVANGKVIGRVFYDNNGYLSKKQTINPSSKKIISETYFHIKGHPVIEKMFSADEGGSILKGIQVFSETGQLIHFFESEAELVKYWIESITKNDLCVVINDEANFYSPIINSIDKKNLKHIGVMHSSHVAAEDNEDPIKGRVNYNHADYFKNLEKMSGLVFLTKRQKEDVAKRFDRKEKLFAISHTYDSKVKKVEFSKRNLSKVVMISRYSVNKKIDLAIVAFAKVVKNLSSASLEIYGFGDQQQFLETLIKEKNLENHVFLMGHTREPGNIFDQAACSLSTSKVEGFGLSNMESLCHGCPVISFEVNYGPSEMIENTKNGYLVPFGDVDKLAKRIVTLLENPKKLNRMSDFAYKSAENFLPEHYAQKWGALLKEVIY